MAIPNLHALASYHGSFSTTESTSTTLQVDYPTNVILGNMLVAAIANLNHITTVTVPAGWTLAGKIALSSELSLDVIYTRALGTESGSLPVTTSSNAWAKASRMYQIEGDGLKIEAVSTKGPIGTKDCEDSPVTTTDIDRLVLNFFAINDDEVIALTGETGGTWSLEFDDVTAAGTDGALQLYAADMATAGTIGGATFTYGGATEFWGGVGFAIYEAPFQPKQDGYRWRNDDGSETLATWKAALNTTTTVAANTNIRLRILIEETNGTPDLEDPDFQLHYRRKPVATGVWGSWGQVGNSDVNHGVVMKLSTHFAQNDATTQQIGSGTFRGGSMMEGDGAIETVGPHGSSQGLDQYEIEWNLLFQTGGTIEALPDDEFEFKVRWNDRQPNSWLELPAGAQVQTPHITISGAAGETVVVPKASQTVTEQAVTLLAAELVNIAKATIATTSRAVTSSIAVIETVTKTAFALTGQAVATVEPIISQIGKTAFALTGQAVSSISPVTETITKTAFALTGQAVNTSAAVIEVITKTAFALTGQAVATVEPVIEQITKTAFALTGQVVNTISPVTETISKTAFALTGQAVSTSAAVIETITKAAFAVTSRAVTTIEATVDVITKTAFALTGQAVSSSIAVTEVITKTAFALTGAVVTTSAAVTVTVANAVLSVTGQAVNSAIVVIESVGNATSTLVGRAVFTASGITESVANAAISVSGANVWLPTVVTISKAAFALTGQVVNASISVTASVVNAGISVTGQAVTSSISVTASVVNAAITVIGQAATGTVAAATPIGRAVITSVGRGVTVAGDVLGATPSLFTRIMVNQFYDPTKKPKAKNEDIDKL